MFNSNGWEVSCNWFLHCISWTVFFNSTCHFNNFMNFDSSIFPYHTLDNDIFRSLICLCFTRSSFNVVQSYLNVLHHEDFLLAENVMPINTHQPAINSCSDSLLLAEIWPVQTSDLEWFSITLAILFTFKAQTRSYRSVTLAWLLLPLPDILIHASDIKCRPHITPPPLISDSLHIWNI
jgi:hypothetical protein